MNLIELLNAVSPQLSSDQQQMLLVELKYFLNANPVKPVVYQSIDSPNTIMANINMDKHFEEITPMFIQQSCFTSILSECFDKNKGKNNLTSMEEAVKEVLVKAIRDTELVN